MGSFRCRWRQDSRRSAEKKSRRRTYPRNIPQEQQPGRSSHPKAVAVRAPVCRRGTCRESRDDTTLLEEDTMLCFGLLGY